MNLTLEQLELELLKHKYRYYVLYDTTVDDYEYDLMESKYFKMLRESGSDPELIEHWVGFDYKHPRAHEVLAALG